MFDRSIIKFGADSWNPRGKYRLYSMLNRLLGMVEGTTPSGVKLKFRPNDVTCYYFFRGDYEVPLQDLISNLPVGGTFIDVGANVGNYSVLASRRVGETGLVVGFEPVAGTYARFIDHLAINGTVNVIPFNAAVAAAAGTAEMVYADDSGLSYIGKVEKSKFQRTQKCAVLSLDDILPPLIESREIDLMKIDVEGAELGVLRGAEQLLRNRQIKRLFIEIFPANLARFGETREGLWSFLEARGYRPRYRRTDCEGYDEIFDRI